MIKTRTKVKIRRAFGKTRGMGSEITRGIGRLEKNQVGATNVDIEVIVDSILYIFIY